MLSSCINFKPLKQGLVSVSRGYNTVNKKNPSQAALAKQSGGLQKMSPILDKWEGAVNFANGLNRCQEALYRNGMFSASLQRQMYDRA